ncbi:MAG TPA: PAS domain-containing protein, partial [Thermoanaerobaculia bacterium]|nr:PAS domain-containing protein [Thermoanaerobaculia bacterium]
MSSTDDRRAKLFERVAMLQERLAQPASPMERQFVEALNGLQMALQELETAEEELAQQNEELLFIRERLEMERHRYRDLFELAPDGYLVTDLAGTIEEANQAAVALLGTPQFALSGKPFSVFILPAERARFRSLIRGVGVGQVLRDLELTLRRAGAEPVPVLLTIVKDEPKVGHPARLRWMLRDLSARKAAEARLRESEERLRHSQRLESIGRLAGGIAHSFNNLLAAIGFHSELLLDRVEGSERVHVEEIQKAGERAASLAGQLLAFGRRQVLQPRVLRLDDILRQMEPMLQRLLGEDVEVRLDLRLGAGAIEADLGQLEQVILNLAVNARDAMPFGGTLTLSTAGLHLAEEGYGVAQLPAGDYVQLTVADTGTGMDETTRTRIFEPFFTTK